MMPLNPNVPMLAFRASPLGKTMNPAADFQTRQEEEQLAAASAQRAERERIARQRGQIERALEVYPDQEEAINALKSLGAGEAALMLQAMVTKTRNEAAAGLKTSLDVQEQMGKTLSGLLTQANEANWPLLRREAQRLDPVIAEMMPPQYDAGWVTQVQQRWVDASTRLSHLQKATDLALASNTRESVALAYGTARNAEEWAQAARFAEMAPASVRALFPATYSPEAAERALSLAEPPKARATREETARHNRALEQAAMLRARRTWSGAASGSVGGSVTGSASDLGGLTPDGVEFAASQYRITGAMPPMGMGQTRGRTAIVNAAAQQAKELKQSPAVAIQKQSAFKADAKALDLMQKMRSSAEAFETKAFAQADIIREVSEQVPRTQWPIINSAIQRGRVDVLGDQNAQLLANAITTFTAEYAKIIEGSTGSVAGSSDSARRATERLVNPSLNKGTMAATLDLMQREMDLTIQGYDASIAHITERMGGAPPAPAPATGVQQWVRDKTGRLVPKP